MISLGQKNVFQKESTLFVRSNGESLVCFFEWFETSGEKSKKKGPIAFEGTKDGKDLVAQKIFKKGFEKRMLSNLELFIELEK